MEDALVLSGAKIDVLQEDGLNPCFNGRCTRTDDKKVSVMAHDTMS